jgi:hypothetical protein
MPSAADADLRPRDGPGTAAVDGGGDVRQTGAGPTEDNDNNNDKDNDKDNDNAEAVQRREMMRRAAEVRSKDKSITYIRDLLTRCLGLQSRSAPKGGSLARELDRRKKKGMQGEREAAAAEAVRQREIDQLQKARQGD